MHKKTSALLASWPRHYYLSKPGGGGGGAGGCRIQGPGPAAPPWFHVQKVLPMMVSLVMGASNFLKWLSNSSRVADLKGVPLYVHVGRVTRLSTAKGIGLGTAPASKRLRDG